MVSANKASPSTTTGTARPKKGAAAKSLIIKLKLSPTSLSKFEPVVAAAVKKETESKATSSTSAQTLPTSTPSPVENGSASNGNTPAPSGTDDSVAMPPPAEGVKKTGKAGTKRASLQPDGLPKPRGKPGPKKRKLDDGTADKGQGASAGHKLGPKANQGAINAGLRALDRSGAPCRKWQKGGFSIKSFTGTTWAIPRWRAPPKVTINGQSEGSASGTSSKENKENSQVDSEKSNGVHDIEMASSPGIPESSPAPQMQAIAAA